MNVNADVVGSRFAPNLHDSTSTARKSRDKIFLFGLWFATLCAVLTLVFLILTTLLKGAAKNFMNKKSKCCVQTIELPKGARVLPLMVMSRYADEFEMLLESTPSKTRKLK